MSIYNKFLVFDVESIGLHGDAFAFGAVTLEADGEIGHERFKFSCPRHLCNGFVTDRAWVDANVPHHEPNTKSPSELRDEFWRLWLQHKAEGYFLAADCGWPVESRFLASCVDQGNASRISSGPYPFCEISSFMLAAKMDPMKYYERLPEELPIHDPLADALQSAHMLREALIRLGLIPVR